MGVKRQQFRLLFRYNGGEFELERFRECCLYQQNTLLIFRTMDGYIRGGYIEEAWTNTRCKEDLNESMNAIMFTVFPNRSKYKRSMNKKLPIPSIDADDRICFGQWEFEAHNNQIKYFGDALAVDGSIRKLKFEIFQLDAALIRQEILVKDNLSRGGLMKAEYEQHDGC